MPRAKGNHLTEIFSFDMDKADQRVIYNPKPISPRIYIKDFICFRGF